MAEFGQEASLGVSSCPVDGEMPLRPDKVASNFSWLMAGEIGSKGLAFAATIYLIRVLGSAGFGMFSFATAFAVYGALATDFGLSAYGTREIARKREGFEECVSNVLSTRLLLSAIVFIIASILSLTLLHDRDTQLLFIFSFLWLFPYAFGLDWAFRGLEKMRYSSLWNILQQAGFLVLMLFVVGKAGDLVRVPLCKTVGTMIASGALLIGIRKTVGWKGHHALLALPDPQVVKRMLQAGISLAIAYLLIQVYWNIGTIILGIIDTPEAVGNYAAAYRIILLAASLGYTITNAYYPGLSYDFRHNHANYRRNLFRMLRTVTVLGIAAGLMIYLFRGLIAAKLFGEGYSGSAQVLAILAFAVLGDYVASSLGTALIAAGREKLGVIAVLLGAVTNVVLNILLIPRFSYMGAALAGVISYTVIIAYCLANIRLVLAGGKQDVPL